MKRRSLLGFADVLSLICFGGTVQAASLWYDRFAISDAGDGAGPNYVAGNLAGQMGGAGVGASGAGPGFFDDAFGNPHLWMGVNNMDDTADDSHLSSGSLMRGGNPNPPPTGRTPIPTIRTTTSD